MKTTMQRNNQQQHSDQDAIHLFNDIKETYSLKIDELNELKRNVFVSENLDQQLRSKLRITIESLLIDLNEEIFSISEELAKSFTFEKQKNIYRKAQEFEQRKNQLLRKIKECIDQNPSVKSIRRQVKIQNASPPQRDLNTFGHTYEHNNQQDYQKGSTRKTSQSPGTNKNLRKINSLNRLQDGFQSDGGNTAKARHQFEPFQNDISSTTNTNRKIIRQSVKHSLRKKKSPCPLRRKDETVGGQSFVLEGNGSARKQSISSRHALSAKKQLFNQDSSRKETKKDQKLTKNIKRLEEFEKYLAKKQGNSMPQDNKENRKPETSQYSTIQLQSEAMDNFIQDFAHMKNKMLQMQTKFNAQEDKVNYLTDLCDKLKTENVKLQTDVKIIRNEHSEILHSLFNMEKKNNQLQQENQTLKRILQGERENKCKETNLPKPYIENINDQSMTSQNYRQEHHQQEHVRKTSPFTTFLQKNRSFSKESKDSNNSTVVQTQSEMNKTHQIGSYRQGDFISFQPGANQAIYGGNQDFHNVRDSQNTWQRNPNHQPQLSNERIEPSLSMVQNNTYQFQNKPHGRMPSIGQSRQYGDMVIQETPTAYDQVLTDETPYQQQRMEIGNSNRGRSFLIQQNRMTPTSSSQQIYLGQNNNNDANLSDWVLQRINNQSK